MELPPEIRNQIYSYLFLPLRLEIIRAKEPQSRYYRLYHHQLRTRDPETGYIMSCCRYSAPQDSFSTARLSLPEKPRTKGRGKGKPQAKANTTNKKPRRWPPQLALLFVSRQSAVDTVGLLYSCTQFVFDSTKAISRFLDSVSPIAKSAIKHVELLHRMYNEPRLSQYRPIKLRSDQNWFVVCERMADALTNLNVLHVHMAIFDAPINLEVGEDWSLALLAFSGKGGKRGDGGGLRFVKVNLGYPHASEEKIRNVEAELEARLMDPVALQVREDEKLAREMAGHIKASKVLRLFFN
ncbi:hypothetical protein BJX68DRAFT_20935 [Aspergillus pseudodeflectus]|uniref:DUF7730 domain-containing protein n=1 Tax=Aspergillus pseudodeflectus TaxID=176178 RepID=A0ABR4KRZ6_9EURO